MHYISSHQPGSWHNEQNVPISTAPEMDFYHHIDFIAKYDLGSQPSQNNFPSLRSRLVDARTSDKGEAFIFSSPFL